MRIVVFIDETGTILNPQERLNYGVGFAYAPDEYVEEIERRLFESALGKIHVRTIKSDAERIDVARQVKALKLQELKLNCGAAIRTDHSHADQFTRDFISTEVAARPEKAMLALEQSRNNSLKSKTIILLEDIFPKVFSSSRLMEFMVQSTRYPLLRILQHYADGSPLEIHFLISSIGRADKYLKKLSFAFPNPVESLNAFMGELHKAKAFPRDCRDFTKVSYGIVERADGIFGLADLFGSIGQRLAKDPASKEWALGEQMYAEVSELIATGPAHGQEVKKGVFLLQR